MATVDTSNITNKVNNMALQEDDEITPTVLKSTEDFTVIHPLTHTWTLWYTKPNTGKEPWHELLKPVVTLQSVEEFWGVYNSIPKVTDLQLKSDYSFFKEGVRPEWEDAHNAAGGKWSFSFKDSRSRNGANMVVDDCFLRLLLGVIGGTIDNDIEIVQGVVVSVRKAAIRVSLWTSTTDVEQLNTVGVKFKKVLGLGDNDDVEFVPHAEADQRPSRQNKLTI